MSDRAKYQFLVFHHVECFFRKKYLLVITENCEFKYFSYDDLDEFVPSKLDKIHKIYKKTNELIHLKKEYDGIESFDSTNVSEIKQVDGYDMEQFLKSKKGIFICDDIALFNGLWDNENPIYYEGRNCIWRINEEHFMIKNSWDSYNVILIRKVD